MKKRCQAGHPNIEEFKVFTNWNESPKSLF